jgi:hypothetical protein
MRYIPLPKIKTISEQSLAVRIKHPDFKVNSTFNSVSVKGWSRPTLRSVIYRYEMTYVLSERPAIKIVDPVLEKFEGADKLPHVHEGDELCLFYPFYHEFTHRELLTDTVIPWIALWIYYYEKWVVSGKWLGGGVH